MTIGKVIGNVNGVDVLVGSTWRCKDGVTGEIQENIQENKKDYPVEMVLGKGAWRTFTDTGYYYGSLDPIWYDLNELLRNPEIKEKQIQETIYTEKQIREVWYELIGGDRAFNVEDMLKAMHENSKKQQDPEYQKYLELKAKFEGGQI